MNPTLDNPSAHAAPFAIVTGAAQGLGYAIVKAYLQARLRVAMLDVQREKLLAAHGEFQQTGGGDDCLPIIADLTRAEATQAAIAQALAWGGTPRCLVHNAAILNMLPFEETGFDEWTRVLNVNLHAAFLLTHAVWEPMKAAGQGSIVYVSSRSGVEGFAGESAYCASKHGLEGLMKSLALEGKAHNIAVNTITPGMYMQTPMSERNYSDELKQKWVDPFLLTPAFLHLAAQDAQGITGQRLSAWELSQTVTRRNEIT